jgi:hypothetical protein
MAWLAAGAWAQNEGRVLMDTSPGLYLADLVNIERTIQFATGRWLCSRERARVYQGVIDEWAMSDAGARGQMLEFAAVAAELDQLPDDSRAAVRESIQSALHEATGTGRPLGEAILALEVADTTPALRGQRPTRSQLHAWTEIQELMLSIALASPVRIPEERAREMAGDILRADPGALSAAHENLARISTGWVSAPSEEVRRAVAGALGVPSGHMEVPGEPFVDPLGLFALNLPVGWSHRPDLDPAEGGSAFASERGAVMVVSASAPQREVVEGTRSVGAALGESLARLDDARLIDGIGDEGELAAFALAERGQALLLVVHMRAPGDSALVTIVCRAPRATLQTHLPDFAALLGSLRFSEAAWRSGADWSAVKELRRGNDTLRSAAERDLTMALRQALGCLAIEAVGVPTRALSADELSQMLGSPPAPPLLQPPADPMGGGPYG